MPDQIQRFWLKVDRRGDDECWPWTAYISARGYGQVKFDGKVRRAHRVAWMLAHEQSVPDDKVIDQLCRNRACVNPSHLEVTTNRVNVLRGVSMVAENARKTHCSRGHAYESENTPDSAGGKRRCWACVKQDNTARHEKVRAGLLPPQKPRDRSGRNRKTGQFEKVGK